MATAELNKVIGHLRSVLCMQEAAGLTDGELLERYLRQRDEAAFEALVRRHGPTVLGVCRRILRNPHDAEDAFQATFLVLLHKAFSLRSSGTVGNWLYGVACRTAQEARRAILKRRNKEAKVVPKPEAPADDLNHIREALDQELERLPEKYRAAIVLFDLEGATGKEVALQLGVPEGTVASRLARGRALLAKRLIRHGLSVTAGALAGILSQQAASACVLPSLVASTMKTASLFAAGKTAAAGVISAQVAALTNGVMKTMVLNKLKAVASVVFVVAVLGAGAGGLIHRTPAAEQLDAQKSTANADTEKHLVAWADQKTKSDLERIQGTWKIVATYGDGEQSKHEGELVGKWVFKGRTAKLEMHSKGAKPELKSIFRFRLDETTTPKQIDGVEPEEIDDLSDLAELDKRLNDPNKRGEGIYSLREDTLILCMGSNPGERPTAFESKQGSKYHMIVLQREAKEAQKDGGKPAITRPAQKVQIRIKGPVGMKVCLWPESGKDNKVAPIEVPGRLNLEPGKRSRLKLYGIPNRPGVERFPAVEIPETNVVTEPFVTSSAIPVEFTDEDFVRVNSGWAIMKVVYLTTGTNGQKKKVRPGGPMGMGMGAPRPGGAEPETKGQKTVGRPGGMPGPGSTGMMAGPQPMMPEAGGDQGQVHTIASYDYPQRDVIEVARQRGTILAVVRMGNIDLGAGEPGKYQGRVRLLEKTAGKPVEITLGDDGIQGRVFRPDKNAKAKDKDKRAEQLAKHLEIVERDLVRVQGWNNDLKKRLEEAEMWKRSLQTLLECKEQELKRAKADLKKARAPGGKSQTEQRGGSDAAFSSEIGLIR